MKSLIALLKEVDDMFPVTKDGKPQTHSFSLDRWQGGLWGFTVTDNWHKWMDAGYSTTFGLSKRPEHAVILFLDFVKRNNINVKKLAGD